MKIWKDLKGKKTLPLIAATLILAAMVTVFVGKMTYTQEGDKAPAIGVESAATDSAKYTNETIRVKKIDATTGKEVVGLTTDNDNEVYFYIKFSEDTVEVELREEV